MIESMLSAWSLASMLPRVYTLSASLLGEITVVGFLASKDAQSVERPTDVVAVVFDVVQVPAPPVLASVSRWVQERGDVLTVFVGIIAAVAMARSVSYLVRNRYRFDKVRGPATFWIAAAVIAEARGRSGLIVICVALILLGIMAVGIDVVQVRSRRREFLDSDDQRKATYALGGFLLGALVVLCFAVGTFVHAIGGPRRTSQTVSSPRITPEVDTPGRG